MRSYVIGFNEINATKPEMVGGKGANLGELCKIEGVNVPEGFSISAEAYKRTVEGRHSLEILLQQITLLGEKDRVKIIELSAAIRKEIEGILIPENIREDIARFLSGHEENVAYAIRSSATAEDMPAASFAGQQDTYLNIIGQEAILKYVSRCWASLFTDRAVIYRIRNGFDHRKVSMAVVVQKMVFAEASGIMFTADPLSSHRKVLSIDAGFGLGESLVSGLVNADSYKVINGKVTEKRVATKRRVIHAVKEGGIQDCQIAPEHQNRQVLTDEQILQLENIGREIEKHFGNPQDIEWCLVDDHFYIVQSRPITTLYPIPESSDQETHVYISVGHQQMMTDPMKPLGLSFFLLTTPAPMRIAGGRLFVDITSMLFSAHSRETVLETLGKSDPLIKSALLKFIQRGDIIHDTPGNVTLESKGSNTKGLSASGVQPPINFDPAIVSELIYRNQSSIETLQQTIETKSGPELFDFILEDIRHLKQFLFDPQSLGLIHAAIDASAWINEKIMEWLGEKGVADIISQSVPHNITSEMGLALLDVADAIRPYPDIIEYLKKVKDEDFLDGLDKLEGGKNARKTFQDFLLRYGMRCAGEIDITRPRWIEKKSTLIPLILSHIRNFRHNAGRQKWEQGLKEALNKQEDILRQLKAMPDGPQKAEAASRKIALVRNFIGFREYPKYGMVYRYLIYKEALLKEAQQLVLAGVISEIEDIYYLSFEEFREVVNTGKLDASTIFKRKEDFRFFEKLTPPRVITSDGEIITGTYNRESLPAGAIPGLAVSSGIAEGRARVIFKMEDANLEEGDILVTTFTDPSWTPLFVSIKGLVTEVGGLMTHGAVIAREYGLPAVVGVEKATQLIKDGQQIRVHGTEGYVEIL